MCVPQVVKAHAFKTVSIGEAAKPFTRRVVVQLRAVPSVDDPTFPHPHVAGPCLSVALVFARFMEYGHHAGRQRDQAFAGFRLRRALEVARLRRVLQGVAYVDGTMHPVHIGQAQRAHFAQTQAAEQRQQQGGAIAHIRLIVQAAQQLDRALFREIIDLFLARDRPIHFVHGVFLQ